MALKRIQYAKHLLIGALFMVLIWTPALESCLHFDHAPIPNENRSLAGKPVFNGRFSGLRDYFANVENYFDDHFGMRNRLIRTSAHWKRELFRQPTRPDVVVGKDGWLYFSGDKTLEDWYGRMSPTPNELRDWKTLLETRRDWLQRRGIKYIFVVPPNKQTVYPEHLPDWMPRAHPLSRAEQILSYLKTNTTVEIVDLHPILTAEAKQRTVFLLTDTHWNHEGILLGFQALVDAANREGLHLKQYPRSAFHEGPPYAYAGDLAKLLGEEARYLDRETALMQKDPPDPATIRNAAEMLSRPEPNPEKVPVIVERKNHPNTVILFHDSFARGWKEYLSWEFGRSIYVWSYTWDPFLIEREKPILVIDEMVERFLDTSRPEELLRLDGLK